MASNNRRTTATGGDWQRHGCRSLAAGIGDRWSDAVPNRRCGECHSGELRGYSAGRHGMKEAAGLGAVTVGEARIPMRPDAAERVLDCTACHSSHAFDTRRAAVEACLGCHAAKTTTTRSDRISRYFDTVDMDGQRAKQKAFLTFAFGGPAKYSGRDMRSAHSKLELSEADFAAVMENLGATLQELNVPAGAEAAGIAMSVKDDVLNK